MDEKQTNRREGTGCIVAFLIIFAIIIGSIIISSISNSVKESQDLKHESNLIEQGKTKNDKEVIDEIIEILKKREKEKLKEYLYDDFSYWNNNNYESKFISGFWSDLKQYTGKLYIDKRGNSLNGQETYWIYWDIPEKLDRSQYADYCLQRVMIYLRRVTKDDIITYEIEKIVLKDN